MARRSRRLEEQAPGLPESFRLRSVLFGRQAGARSPGGKGKENHAIVDGRRLRPRRKRRRLQEETRELNFTFQGRPVRCLCREPRVYAVDGFLTDAEVDHLLGEARGAAFEGSYTEDDGGNRVVSEQRTSTFFWLGKGADVRCRAIEARAAELLGLHAECVEPLQIVSYTEGQHFDVHHDAGTWNEETGAVEGACSPLRIATLFVYLNDLPEGEGRTEFPALGLSVQPRRGMAVLWPNVDARGVPEPRTIHKACPVAAGQRKFGCNVWITDSNLSGLALLPKPKKKKKKKKKKKGGGKRSKGASGAKGAKRAKGEAAPEGTREPAREPQRGPLQEQ